MKSISIHLFFLLFLLGCQNSKEYLVEEQILNCFYQTYREAYDIDIKASIDSANQILIQYGVIADNSGKSYIELLKKINQENNFTFKSISELVEKIASIHHFPKSIICQDLKAVDSLSYAKSKWIKVIENITSAIETQGDFSPQLIAGELLHILNEKDFEHPFYQTLATLYIFGFLELIDHNSLHSNLLTIPSPKLNPSPSFNKDNMMRVSLDRIGQIRIDGEIIKEEVALEKMRNFISQNPEKHAIGYETGRGVRYLNYLQLLDKIKTIFFELKNEYAQSTFQKKYFDLEEAKQKIVDEKIPLNIIESEPTHIGE